MIVKEINTNMLVAPTHEVIFTELSDIGDVLGEVVITVDSHEISGYGTEAPSSSQPIPSPGRPSR